jgi:hypothetical protein
MSEISIIYIFLYLLKKVSLTLILILSGYFVLSLLLFYLPYSIDFFAFHFSSNELKSFQFNVGKHSLRPHICKGKPRYRPLGVSPCDGYSDQNRNI